MFFGLYQNGHINYVTVKRSSRMKLSIVFIVQKWRILLTVSCQGPLRKLMRDISFKIQ